MKLTRKHDLIAACALATLPLIIFFDVAFLGSGFFIRDISSYFIPTQATVRACAEAGEFPFWNPLVAGGQPMAANPDYSVLYPLTWLFFGAESGRAFQWTLLLHFAIASVGMYVLLRSLKLGLEGSVIGALGFGLGGFFLSYHTLGPFLFALSWMPLVLAAARRAVLEPNPRSIALAALVGGMQLLAGEPGVIVQTSFMIAAWLVWRWWGGGRTRAEGFKLAAVIAAVAAGAALIGCIQIVAAIDLVGDSIRSRGLAFHVVSAWSMPPSKLLELFFPHLMGEVDPANGPYWAGALYGSRAASPYVTSLYVGLPLAICAAAGLISRIKGWGLALLLIAISSVLAFGSHTPVFQVLYDLGLTRSYRYPEKLILMGIVTAVIFGAVALDRCLSGERRVLRSALTVSAAVAVAAIGGALFTRIPALQPAFASLWGDFTSVAVRELARAAQRGWILAVLRSFVLAVTFVWISRGGSRRIFTPLLFTVALVDLAPLAREVARTMPSVFFTKPASVDSLPRQKQDYRMFHEAYFMEKAFNIRAPSLPGDDGGWSLRNGLFPLIGSQWGVATVLEGDYDASALLPTTDFYESMYLVAGPLGRVPEAFLDMGSVGVIARLAPLSGDTLATVRGIRFEERVAPLPYWFARRVVKSDSAETFREHIRSGRWRKGDALVAAAPFVPAPGRVLSASRTCNTLTLDVASDGRSFLVVGTTPHKYWRATMDGRPVRLQVVNAGFQGMEIPAGRHELSLRYRNDMITRLAPVSAIAACCLIGIAAANPRRRTEAAA